MGFRKAAADWPPPGGKNKSFIDVRQLSLTERELFALLRDVAVDDLVAPNLGAAAAADEALLLLILLLLLPPLMIGFIDSVLRKLFRVRDKKPLAARPFFRLSSILIRFRVNQSRMKLTSTATVHTKNSDHAISHWEC
jgi:hypothetical protein